MGRLSLDRVRRGLESPALFGREANRAAHTSLFRRPYNVDGHDVFAEEWDNLVILDACRFDLFEQLAADRFDGELERRVSRGSSTVEWLRGNVAGRELLDVVYISSNPQYVRRFDAGEFYAVVDVWNSPAWDRELGTVPAPAMSEAVLEAAERWPDKRLLAHYMQPHYPFLGPTAEEFLDRDGISFWSLVMTGELDVSDAILRRAYRETFELALPDVVEVVDELEGLTVVSSDHGQMIGDRAAPIPIKEYGHPRQVYTPELVKIPWFVAEADRRRTTIAEAPVDVDRDRGDVDEQLDERLAALGYA